MSISKLDEINKIKIDVIKNAKQSDGASNGTVNRTLSLLRAILNKVQLAWEWLDSTPCIRLLPIRLNRICWLTNDKANRLLKELPDHLNAMARFSLATGLRARLQWSQIDMQRRCAWIHPDLAKSARAISVPFDKGYLETGYSQENAHAEFTALLKNISKRDLTDRH